MKVYEINFSTSIFRRFLFNWFKFKKTTLYIFFVLLSSISCAQLVTNGSITGAPCANSGINTGNAAGWSGCGFSPDLCCLAMPSYVATSQVAPSLSPDGGTWLGLAALVECAKTTITGLTIGTTYTLYFCGACFGTGTAIYNSAPSTPRIIVGTSTFVPSIPMVASTWNKYSMTFVASAATMTLQCDHPNGSNSYASLDGFSLSSASPCGPVVLPIELIKFTVSYNQASKKAELAWWIAMEENLDYYSVENSTNGLEFGELSKVYANSTKSIEPKTYFIEDGKPLLDQLNYYRIVAVDKDGQKSISQIQALKIDDDKANLIISPNPAKDNLKLSFYSELNKYWYINVINSNGTIIETHEFSSIKNGTNIYLIDVSKYNSGLFFLNVSDGQSSYKKKFIKE